jgi:ABC-type lipoprotein release transport system permease subunit
MYAKLAWRNLWRNKRRTLITAASVFFAVLLAIFMESMQLGGYSKMIENVVGFYSGYAQVHQKGYWDDQVLDNTIEKNEALELQILAHPEVSSLIPRLESFALASSPAITKGCQVVGIDPESENRLTRLKDKLVSGTYLQPEERSVLVAEDLASQLELGVGDTLVLLGQGYQGVNAAGLFPISGIVRFGSPDLNKVMVYMPLKSAQWLYGAPNRLTSYVMLLNDPEAATQVANAVRKEISDAYEVMDWKEMMPELVQSIEADYAGGIIYLGVLYVIIGFGIFGTLLMMTAERMHEFGIMVAIGMKKLRLGIIVAMETVLIALLGVLAGSAAALPLVVYFNVHPIVFTGEAATAYEGYGLEPIIPTLVDPGVFLHHGLFVLLVTLILAGYPVWRIHRLEAVEAMRN